MSTKTSAFGTTKREGTIQKHFMLVIFAKIIYVLIAIPKLIQRSKTVLGRHYVGYDILPEYCELAKKRLHGGIRVRPGTFGSQRR